MRPRKAILCVDPNEQGLSVRKFALETRGYRVHTAASAVAALNRLTEQGPTQIYALLSATRLPDLTANQLVIRAKAIDPDIFTIVVADNATTAELLTELRVGTVRKRGPKKAPAGASFPVPGDRAEALQCA